MKLRLKKDLIIPAGTVMSSHGVPPKSVRDAASYVMHTMPFGKNASGQLFVGAEVGDLGFDEWFEPVPNGSRRKS